MADWIKCVNEDCQYFVEHGEYHEVCKDQKIKKIVTNADHIRSMSDEELADFLEEFEACDVCKYYDKNRCTFENPCVHEFAGIMIWEWLKSPTTD